MSTSRDHDGDFSHNFEHLEPRKLLSASMDGGGTLEIRGTDGDDVIVTALQVVLKCSTPIPAAAGVGVLSFGVRGQVVSASNRHPLLASTSTTLLKMRRDHILRTAIHSGEQPVREAISKMGRRSDRHLLSWWVEEVLPTTESRYVQPNSFAQCPCASPPTVGSARLHGSHLRLTPAHTLPTLQRGNSASCRGPQLRW